MKPNKNAENLRNIDSVGHLRGESIYVDDIPLREGTLFAAVFTSPKAHGLIKKLDVSEALKCEGVHKVLTHKDILHRNQIGGIVEDQPLFAEDKVMYMGQPVALVLAESEKLARLALNKISIEIEELEVITCPRIAQSRGELKVPSRTFAIGDTDFAFRGCEHVVEGSGEINGQEHLYI